MISRKNRFHGRGSLNYVYKKGKSIRGEHIALRYIASNRADYRLAVVVSRKVSKSAVVRNRIRRRIYEIIRLAHKEAAQQWQYDFIITVFDDHAATVPSDILRDTVISLLNKSRRP